ncbi:two-component system, OmpR family, phosphate regulon sensor histidine kinase PhoR [Tistlia consotensis]|uniref:histidine kinase n=1 Tax=Tistlia consotensis USBA 355 TaxID=560819 RepID=A0A1Y6BBK0_9PROT|nr:ATP-binding protein [Tistlia consotensis]SME94871.1 two-component system, OmpR family, phosphate regulon sensor histidine kinase PhoR [Tistlia consotensis USBA 355]SNR29603.1 two-component system, OmpR family, phosphate regulon sensor histidine kinase PhoR [Tistlia consotensis]
MAAKSTLGRRLPVALFVMTLPSLAALGGLWLLGRLDGAWALGALAVVVAGLLLLLYPHFHHIEALRRYVASLPRASEAGGSLPKPPASGSQLLAPELDQAIIETARERERRRRELEAAMAGNESILSTLPDPLIMLDRNRRIVRANPAAETLFGDGTAGRNLTGVLRNPQLLAAADAAVSGEGGRVVEFTLTGEVEQYFSARVVPLTTPALDGTVAIVSLHNLTSVRRAERMRADFVANASHELRTPLSSLLGFIETLLGPARDDGEARERFLAIMHEQALRMARLVEDLLSLSRIEMREHTPPDQAVDPQALLDSVVGALELRARAKDMRLEVRILDHLPVVGDKDELAQVFQNLIDNAIKYGRAGTAVRVVARRAEPAGDAAARRVGRPVLAIAVSDEGEGIAREHLPRLTERFYRVDTARSRELGGTGLGLAIVKHIVNRHRGHLTIDSKVGKGTTFTVFLPLAESAAQRPPQPAAVRRAG